MVNVKTKLGKYAEQKVKNPLTGKAHGVNGGIKNPLSKSPKMSGDKEAKTTKAINKFLGK